jgi:hypothetical protein
MNQKQLQNEPKTIFKRKHRYLQTKYRTTLENSSNMKNNNIFDDKAETADYFDYILVLMPLVLMQH